MNLLASLGKWRDSLSRPTLYVLLLSGALFVAFSVFTSLLYLSFWQGGTDFGSYLHSFYTTLHRDGWLLQGKYRANHPNGSYWGAHFSVTVLLYIIPFALVQSPFTLLVTKAAVVAASIPMFWVVARHHIDDVRLAGVAVVSYAFNPFFWSAWVFDVQEQAFIPLFGFAAYYAYLKRRWLVFLVVFSAILLTNEFEIYVAAGFLLSLVVISALDVDSGRSEPGLRSGQNPDAAADGGYISRLPDRLHTEGPILLAAGVALLVIKLFSGYVIGAYTVETGIPAVNIADPFVRHLDAEGGVRVSVGQLLGVLIEHPLVAIESLLSNIHNKVQYLILFLAPTLLVPVLSWVSVLSLAPFLAVAWVFTDITSYQQFVAHYPFYLLPYIYIGYVRALDRYNLAASFEEVGRRLPSRELFVRVTLVVALIGVAGSLGGTVGYRYSVAPDLDPERSATIDAAVDSIPHDASVLTQNALYPRVAMRPNATFVANENFDRYTERYGLPLPEYILLDHNVKQHFNTRSSVAHRIMNAYGDRLGSEYGLYRYQNGVAVYKRGYEGQARGLTRPNPISVRGYGPDDLRIGAGTRQSGSIVYRPGNRTGQPNTVWYGPYETLPPGNYTAVFRTRVTPTEEGAGNDSVVRLQVAAGRNHTVVADRPVSSTDGYRNVTVPFDLDHRQNFVEFRGRLGEREGRVELRWIQLHPRQAGDTRNATEGSDG